VCVLLAIAVVVFLILAAGWLYDDAMGPDAALVSHWLATYCLIECPRWALRGSVASGVSAGWFSNCLPSVTPTGFLTRC
jgi:hypothetical protein